ncbi:response regulator [Glaciimonas sp. GG7]
MTERTPIHIMFTDDHVFVRAGVRRLLEQDARFSVVAEAETGERAYQLYGECLPDVCVMDLSMPGLGGMEAIKKIVSRYAKAKLLVLSMHDNAAFCYHALNAGAKGYLAKNSLAEELVDAIDTIIRGQIYISSDISRKIAAQQLDGNAHPMKPNNPAFPAANYPNTPGYNPNPATVIISLDSTTNLSNTTSGVVVANKGLITASYSNTESLAGSGVNNWTVNNAGTVSIKAVGQAAG